MRERLKTLPNQLTAARLVMLPVLWVFVLLKMPVYAGLGVLLAFVTDYLDGHIARRLGQSSEWGSKFDSLADNLLIPSGLVWLGLLRPEVYQEHALLWLAAVLLYFGSLLVGAVKFRRFANLHLKSRRYGSVFMYLFLIQALIMEHYIPLLFYIAIWAFIVSAAEGLLLQLISPRVDAHMGSILFVFKNRSRG